MIKYPDGRSYNPKKRINRKDTSELSLSSSNRGMDFESMINSSNEYYKQKNIALITKRPTPINVVKVDYSSGNPKIVNAYFEKQSTTDYNGVYKGKYIDFEAKSTMSKTSFPLANIPPHQIDHLKGVIKNKGIAFFIIRFSKLNECYLLDASFVIEFYEKGDRKSIPYNVFKSNGILLTEGYNPRVDFISAIDELYFK